MSSFCLAMSDVTARLLKPTRPSKVIIESLLSLALASISVTHLINLARCTIPNKERYFVRNRNMFLIALYIPVALLVHPCDDKLGFNLCKTLNVYILTRHTTGCYETGHPMIRPCFKIVVLTSVHSVVPICLPVVFLTVDEYSNKQTG